MNSAVFISAGIGNALILVPLLKELKQRGKVTIISTSKFHAHEIFEGFDHELFDKKVELDGNIDWLKHSTVFRKSFDEVYLDFFAATRKNLMLAHLIGKKVITNEIPRRLPLIFRKKIKRLNPQIGVHEGAHYLSFAIEGFSEKELNEHYFALRPKKSSKHSISHPYITIQPGSGNNNSSYKTWPIERWLEVIEWLLEHSSCHLVILGDEAEIELSEALPENPKVLNLIGKTSMQELPDIIHNADLHLGHDSGLMHIAGCTGTPTITVWGGSDPDHFGWHKIAPEKHFIIRKKLSCQPCNRWIAPNTSKVELPWLCPDFKCLNEIRSISVIELLYARYS